MSSDSNKRIMKNTGFLYIRMLVIMLVNLYISRVVLGALGIDNYGVYMVVGGVVSMFGFLNSSMISSTQRYLNFELGRSENNNSRMLSNIFSTSFIIHLIIAVVILIAGETLGVWFINAKLNIPDASMYGANIVFQTALFSFLLTIITVPFNASIIAHEKMNLFAIISILEATLKLATAFTLLSVKHNRLALYGVLLLSVQGIISVTYILTSIVKFKECSLRIYYTKSLIKEMSSFAGWNMFGSLAWLVRGQGMGILLNIFFGPVLNAAKGIADQVSAAVNNLNGNFQTALNPQITKNYAAGEEIEMEKLTYRGIKFSSFLLYILAFPIIICSHQVLNLWLENVPEYAPLFVILILVDAMCGNLFGTPLMTALAATGRIKTYQITVSAVIVLILPAAYFALKAGMPPQSIFYLNIGFNILSGVVRLYFCKHLIGFNIYGFIKSVLKPAFTVAVVCIIPPLLLSQILPHMSNICFLITMGCFTLSSTIITIWIIGLDANERKYLSNLFTSKIKKSV